MARELVVPWSRASTYRIELSREAGRPSPASQNVRLVLLQEHQAGGAVDARQLLSRLLVEGRLDVEDPDGDVGRQLVHLALDAQGGEMPGDVGELLEAIGERALQDDGGQIAMAPGGLPDRRRWTRVGGVGEAGMAVVGDEAARGDRVIDVDRGHPQIAHALLP